MDPTSGAGFDLAKTSLETIRNLTELALRSKKDAALKLSASESIKTMGAQLHTRAKALRDEFAKMQEHLSFLRDRGYDVSKPLAEVRKQGWFYKILPMAPYRLLRDFSTQMTAAANLTGSLFEDILGIANCMQAEDEVADAIKAARSKVQKATDHSSLNTPMDQLVAALREEAEELVKLTATL